MDEAFLSSRRQFTGLSSSHARPCLVWGPYDHCGAGQSVPLPPQSPVPAPQAMEIDMSKTFAAVGALLAAATLVVPTASQADESNSMRVSYADLNLASKAGQGVLTHRIVHAAQVVCVIEDSRE